MINEILRKLGMTQNEIEIYLTLLSHGEMSVNDIGSKAGLHRQVCYDVLDRLLEKGFVSYVSKNSKKFFKALSPGKITDYLDERKYELDEIKHNVNTVLPELNSMFRTKDEETEVEVIKGKKVLRTILNDVFRTIRERKDTLYIIGVEETKHLKFDEMAIKQHIYRLRRNNLKEKLLSKESATEFFEGSQSEYRLVPDYLFNPNPVHIYADKLAYVIWGNPVFGIVIKNRELADSARKQFQMLWKIAKPRKKK